MSYEVETEEYKGYTIRIMHDEDAQNPRTDFDNMGTMVFKADNRSTLGDEQHPYVTDDFEFVEYFIGKFNIPLKDCHYADCEVNEFGERFARKWLKNNVVIIPINVYEHGGITVKPSGYGCEYGYNYMSKKLYAKEHGFETVKLTKPIKQRIKEILNAELTLYDDYLTGNVYGHIIEDKDGVEIDSCWGWYGDWNAENGLVYEAKRIIDYDIKNTN